MTYTRNSVSCWDIDDIGAYVYPRWVSLLQTEQRRTELVIPYRISLGYFRCIAGGVAAKSQFSSEAFTPKRQQRTLRTWRPWFRGPTRSKFDLHRNSSQLYRAPCSSVNLTSPIKTISRSSQQQSMPLLCRARPASTTEWASVVLTRISTLRTTLPANFNGRGEHGMHAESHSLRRAALLLVRKCSERADEGKVGGHVSIRKA